MAVLGINREQNLGQKETKLYNVRICIGTVEIEDVFLLLRVATMWNLRIKPLSVVVCTCGASYAEA
jgi:spore maturation protein SpmB